MKRAAGCPDVVALQENVVKRFVQVTPDELVGPLTLLRNRLPVLQAACGFRADRLHLRRAGRCTIAVSRRHRTASQPGATTTGLFASEPNPFASACGPAPPPICWPSDHAGTALNLSCQADDN